MFLIYYLLLMIVILIAVGFVTLLERSVLGYMQLRKGPNKVGLMGLLQPFSDGIKLFFKEQSYPNMSNYMIYYFSPIFLLLISFTLWLLLPCIFNYNHFELGLMFFMGCSGLGVYGVMLSGWSSNSKYSLLGSIRAVAQTISYEISMIMILLCFFVFVFDFNFLSFFKYKECYFLFFSFPLFFCWLFSCLAETNRSPFDFAEGESELVSGFNVEYSGAYFSFIFLSEYMNIIFMSLMTVIVFFGCNLLSFFFYFLVLVLIFWFIWIRATLPRFRYDKLMYMTWKIFLPISLNYFIFFSMFLIIMLGV